jgi:hypothetical protein
MRRARRIPAAAAALAATLVVLPAAARAATMEIDNPDPAGQGHKDPTPFTPTGGNTAATLGAARLAVFQRAAALWGAQLGSAVPIQVSAQFTGLPCTTTFSVLASTGASTIHRGFSGAPNSTTWYPQALANAIAGHDLDPSADITTEFNSSLGGSSCMPGTTWYLGLDGHPGPGQIDMLTVVLHELAHGLGFQTFEDVTTGAEQMGFPDVFLSNIRQLNASPSALTAMTDAQRMAANVSDPNLYWAGANVQAAASTLNAGLISGHVRLYAPATVDGGSSVSHYSTDLSPDELMEPNYTGPNRNLTLTVDLLRDLGWLAPPQPPPVVPTAPGATRWLVAAALALAAARRLRRAPSTCVR